MHFLPVAALFATAFPVSPFWSRLPLILLALAALLVVLIIATRVRWQGWLASRQAHPRSESLRMRDERLKLALWASGEQFWDYDLIQRHLHRMRADELTAAPNSEITVLTRHGEVPPIHEEDLPLVMERLRLHLQGRTPVFMSEHRMDMQRDGRWIWVRARGRIIERDAEGRPIRIAGTARDITSTRNAEYEHRIASEVMRSMNEAVAVLDWAHHFVAVNPAFTRITGYDEAEITGRPVTMLDSDQHDEAFFDRMEHELQHTGRWSGEVWKVRKDGEEILCRIETNVVPDSQGDRQLYVQVLTDITEQKRAEQELRYLANYDTLTSLPNRSLLSERLSRAIVRARRERGHVAVLFIDLDRFKDINDSLGHATGDRILRAAAARVQQTVGAQHTVARLSGDEFTVVLEDIGSTEDAEAVAQRIIDAFRTPLNFGERLELAVSPSIGISLYPHHAQVPTELLKHADTAMYQAKAMGRHTYQVYSERMDEKNRHRAIVANALRRALEREELSLVFQPRLAIARHRIVGVEALMRWQSAEFGDVSPGQFIPLAEESGLILEIGGWALRHACMTLREWQDAGLEDLTMSVNVSAAQLQRGDLPDLVERALAESGIPAHRLELELTESVIMSHPEQNADLLRACRRLGISLAIDDFGTGYSSLAYLKRLPLTTLKIDQEFIGDLSHDTDDAAITSTIITMGQSLALKVVAEGVETYDQYQFLRNHGCDEVQGHWVSRALPAPDCLRFIREYYPGSGVRAVS